MKLFRAIKSRIPSIGIGPAERVAFGLVAIVVSCMLVLDFAFDIFPDDSKLIREERARISKQLALQAVRFIETGDAGALAMAIPSWVQSDEQVLSAAVRGSEGKILAQSGGHKKHWRAPSNGRSTLQHVIVPLMRGNENWGTFELSFTPLGPKTIGQWLTQPWLLAVLAAGFGGFFLFSLYLRRVFEYLDPQSVLPDRIRSAFDAFIEGVMVVDPTGRVILANAAIRKWVGQDGPSMHGRRVQKIKALNDALPSRTAEHPWSRAMADRTTIKGEYIELEQPGGELRKLTVSCSPVLGDDGAVRGCIATFNDVTEIESINFQLVEALEKLESSRKVVEERNKALQHMAMHDHLTGCLNRRAFFECATPPFEKAKREGGRLCCIIVDIDHFKSFNDRFGHSVGDKVLQVAAEILSGGVRGEDVLCRYGGEEFAIVMPDTGIEEAARVSERLRETFEERAGRSVRALNDVVVTASFGICEIAQHQRLEDLIRDSDAALYQAKEEGRNRVKLHKPPLQAVPV